ncbi:DNA helicase Pif1-like [Trema orientale]|uniref:ATP-dependent DNA helicase n=1 Tax=Trema orientale TaxID=63057 RepID=A0A2P5EYN6_TREOI|nr:DNA helicase Pif1-like [Trema orientale]
MLGTRLFATALSVYRSFSTKSGDKVTYGVQKIYKRKKNARIQWTDQQKQIIYAIRGRKSVFVTGSAGTGKTFLLEHIIKLLRKQYRPSQVFVTASTGVAACALKGQTLHSFAGIGFQMADRDTLLNRVFSDRKACSRWKKAKALVIDETSMLDAQTFDNLEFIARNIRQVDSPWGGIQLEVSGDFFQLPPVKSKGCFQNSSKDDKEFAFEADCWNSSFHLQVELEEVHRQSDPQFIKLLQSIRRGKVGPEELEYLERFRSLTTTDSSMVPEIYPRNADVKRVNEDRMKSLNNEVLVYSAVDSGIEARRKLEGIVPYELALCLGARVMLTKNLNPWRKLVNGATGTIVGFSNIDGVNEDMFTDDEDGEEDVLTDDDVDDETIDVAMSRDGLLPMVEFDMGTTMVIKPATWVVKEGDKVVAERKQIPLMLAWAVSIHKCQGMTIDRLKTDLSKVFEYGMAYVAMSRVRSLEGLHLSGLDPFKIKAHPKVERFYESLAIEKDENCEPDYIKPKEDSRSIPFDIPNKKSFGRRKFRFSLTRLVSSR